MYIHLTIWVFTFPASPSSFDYYANCGQGNESPCYCNSYSLMTSLVRAGLKVLVKCLSGHTVILN